MMTIPQHKQERGGGWFNPKVDAGHIMQAAVLLVALIGWFLISRNNIDTAQGDIKDLKHDTAAGFKEIGVSQDKMKQELLTEIHNNPEVTRRFENIDKRLNEQGQYNRDNDARFNAMIESNAQVRADVEVIKRASNAPIRNAR